LFLTKLDGEEQTGAAEFAGFAVNSAGAQNFRRRRVAVEQFVGFHVIENGVAGSPWLPDGLGR
jgi:hypothetical protein